MPLLDHPEAQALLAHAVLTPVAVRGCGDRLAAFLGRYLPRSCRAERRATAAIVGGGLLSGLRRKTCSRSPSRRASTASPSGSSSAPGSGTTRPSWPSCAVTSPRSWATTGQSR